MRLDPKKIERLKILEKLERPSDVVLFKQIERVESETETKIENITKKLEEIKIPQYSEILESLEMPMDGLDGLDGEKGERGEKGDKGDKGDTGQNGRDGRDGLNGLNGKDGIDGKDGKDGLNGKDGESGTIDSDTKEKLKLLDRLPDIERIARENAVPPTTTNHYKNGISLGRAKNINWIGITPTLTGDQANVDFSSSGSSGGSGFQQITSGAVDGTNQTFTWATAPNVIVVDQGRSMQKVSSDGTINWTGTTTTVLSIAPNFDIFASA